MTPKDKKYSDTNLTVADCYHSSISLFVTVFKLSLCLTCKLNYITGVCRKKDVIYRAQYYLKFSPSTEGLRDFLEIKLTAKEVKNIRSSHPRRTYSRHLPNALSVTTLAACWLIDHMYKETVLHILCMT